MHVDRIGRPDTLIPVSFDVLTCITEDAGVCRELFEFDNQLECVLKYMKQYLSSRALQSTGKRRWFYFIWNFGSAAHVCGWRHHPMQAALSCVTWR